jgi:hypothetical protein
MIHSSRSGGTLGVFDDARIREGLRTGEIIETDLGWTEAMPTWRPLSELETFTVPTPAPIPPSPITTLESPASTAAGAATPEISSVVQPSGLPWEHREQLGFLNALLATIGMFLTRPAEAFTLMKRDAGLLDPLLYALIIGTAGGVISFGFSLMMSSFGMLGGTDSALGAMLGMGLGSFFVLFLTPIFVVLGTFIGAGILHVCLMLLGGANRSFETTFRVVAYGGGSANVFQLVPVCGGMIAGVTALVLYCIGLARAHETSTGRAVGAVLLPAVVCCGGIILFAITISGMAAFGQ